jgi:hypothetical protein
VPEPIKTIGSSCFVRNFMNGSFGDRRSVSLQAVYDLDSSNHSKRSKQLLVTTQTRETLLAKRVFTSWLLSL